MEEDQNPLTIPVARQMLIVSFFLSQGNPNLQGLLFSYVAQQRPHWRLEEPHCRALGALFPAMLALGKQHVHVAFNDSLGVFEELNMQIYAMQETFELQQEMESEKLYTDILHSLIDQDWKYLCKKRKRPNRSLSSSPSRHHDPYLSHYVLFVLKREKTGVALFDELFEMLAEPERLILPKRQQKQVRQIIAAYNRHHPTTPVEFSRV